METLTYPAIVQKDGDGYLVTFRDFDDAVTGGDTMEEALENAVGSLMEVISARIAHREDVPTPSTAKRNEQLIALPPQTTAKALLYREMRGQGINKAELARRLNWKPPQVDRLFTFAHNSKLDQLEAAFHALGRQMVIGVAD